MSDSAVALTLSLLGGAVIVLDSDLRIVSASSEVKSLLGEMPPVGVRAVKILCGEGDARPIADALAAGRATTGSVVRPRRAGQDLALRIHARPLPGKAGWLLQLSADAPGVATAADVNFHGIRTADPELKRVLHIAQRAAATDVTVLVRGETGTGKELLARALHTLSLRSNGPFRAINCASLSPTLLESELFGHARGAFTGAVRDNPGHFRHASGGTLFLDEVAEMPPALQAKLLRVIETGTVIPVGAMDAVQVDVRLVAATHKSLRAEVEAGNFRADLMYRIRKVPLFLPPLRQRTADVALLAQHFIDQFNTRGLRSVQHVSTEAMDVLQRYEWPGNVRELANVLEYAYVVGDGSTLLATDLPPEIVDPSHAPDTALQVNAPAPTRGGSLRPTEHDRIARALERAGGHRGRAAQSLGWSRATLWRHMKRLDMVGSR